MFPPAKTPLGIVIFITSHAQLKRSNDLCCQSCRQSCICRGSGFSKGCEDCKVMQGSICILYSGFQTWA